MSGRLADGLQSAFRGRSVLVTGHTGFKGAWLSIWLRRLGARVSGFALPPATEPSLFELARVGADMDDRRGDIRDLPAVQAAVGQAEPDFVFHLAAQSLVRASYTDPIRTLETNVMGTAHLLEAVRRRGKPCAVVVVTSDKCYENREWAYGYRENDPMGGHDPYSMSKGCAELVTSAWRRSFFGDGAVRVASARAGNVVGGGDWAADRIMPDCIMALRRGAPITVRNPLARRPWQHVLEPLGGYLTLAARLAAPDGARFAEAWNFGPADIGGQSVRDVVESVVREWGGGQWVDASTPGAVHEAHMLALACDKAAAELGWRSRLGFRETMAWTVEWYRGWHDGSGDARAACERQIDRYERKAAEEGR